MIEVDGRVAGGGGIAPLQGGADDICELQKMYFLPVLRGKGLAKRLALQALDFARQHGFRCCYLETTASLTQAVALYEHWLRAHRPRDGRYRPRRLRSHHAENAVIAPVSLSWRSLLRHFINIAINQ